jgi:hypothetical protein
LEQLGLPEFTPKVKPKVEKPEADHQGHGQKQTQCENRASKEALDPAPIQEMPDHAQALEGIKDEK